ncbi:NAD-binding protein, partial [Hominenteromicrobium sp.]
MNIVIMGGGKVGESLARRILEGRRHEVRIIESDRARSLQ